MYLTKYIDKFLAAGIVASLMLAFILYFSGIDNVSSVIIGLLSTILTLQIDQIARVEQSSEKHIAKLGLANMIEKSSNFGSLLSEIVEYTAQIETNKINKIFLKRMILEMEHLRDSVQELSKGRLHTGQNENDLILHLTIQAKMQMSVLSLASANDDWWETPMGIKFFEANVDAIQRGVEIIRVFVFDKQDPIREIEMKKQSSKGVKVYWITLKELPLDLRVGLAVIDDRVGYQLIQTTDGQVSGYTFTTDESDVRRMKRITERVVFMAHQYSLQEAKLL